MAKTFSGKPREPTVRDNLIQQHCKNYPYDDPWHAPFYRNAVLEGTHVRDRIKFPRDEIKYRAHDLWAQIDAELNMIVKDFHNSRRE